MLLSNNSWKDIKNKLLRTIDLTHVKERELNSYGLKQIEFSGADYFELLNYIYSSTLEVKPLERKLELFKSQICRSKEGKTSPYKKLAGKLWDSLNCNPNFRSM